MNCLTNQLLTYADVRDVVEERLEKSKQARLELRSIQAIERKREQEYGAARYKMKRDAKENKKDVTTELETLSRESERKRAINHKRIEELTKASLDSQNTLGLDRAYRR